MHTEFRSAEKDITEVHTVLRSSNFWCTSGIYRIEFGVLIGSFVHLSALLKCTNFFRLNFDCALKLCLDF